jgi:hypothetical protein
MRYLLVCSEFVLKPDDICRRQMDWNLLCRLGTLWLAACFGSNGGGDRRGVFAVGVPGEAVVVGMQCHRCHA